jgi:hypothetical protein
MSDAPTEPADAPVPRSGTEQAVDQEQEKKKAEEPSDALGIVADVGEVVLGVVAAIFDN